MPIVPEVSPKIKEESHTVQYSTVPNSTVQYSNTNAAAKNLPDFKKDIIQSFKKVGNIPDLFLHEQAASFLEKYFNEQQSIRNLDSLTKKWLQNLGYEIPIILIIEGKEHKPVKNGKGYAYPTINGVKVNEEKTEVLLMDGTWQKLTQMQQRQIGSLDLKFIYKHS